MLDKFYSITNIYNFRAEKFIYSFNTQKKLHYVPKTCDHVFDDK